MIHFSIFNKISSCFNFKSLLSFLIVVFGGISKAPDIVVLRLITDYLMRFRFSQIIYEIEISCSFAKRIKSYRRQAGRGRRQWMLCGFHSSAISGPSKVKRNSLTFHADFDICGFSFLSFNLNIVLFDFIIVSRLSTTMKQVALLAGSHNHHRIDFESFILIN